MLHITFIPLLLSLLVVTSSGQKPPLQTLTSANSEFAKAVYAKLALAYDNLVISPYSLHSALSMTSLGAKGQTLQQMLSALQVSGLRDVHTTYQQLINTLSDTGAVDILTANAIFQNPNYPIRQTFKDGVNTMYKAVAQELDYSDPYGPEKKVNVWVEEKTNHMIKDLLQKGTLDQNTFLVLVNTIFFNGSWAQQFDEIHTHKADFHVTSQETVQVDMMRQFSKNFEMKITDDYQILRLPFKGNRFALYIVVPSNPAALLNPNCLPDDYETSFFTGLTSTLANIYIPKFEINFKQSFNDILKSMGMTAAFTGSADFQVIHPEAFISEVLQQAVIKVTEAGTVAAAASVVIASRASRPIEQPVQFYVDKPFLFFVRDDVYKQLYFQGKFSRPSADPTKLSPVVAGREAPSCDTISHTLTMGVDGNSASGMSWKHTLEARGDGNSASVMSWAPTLVVCLLTASLYFAGRRL